MMSQAALFNIRKGARIIDINMGCPAKKVCKLAAGSALLRNVDLVRRILSAVVQVCEPLAVPVTLKTRTGWDRENRNAVEIALLAQSLGISAITLHGRTRADRYEGSAEYDTIAAVKRSIDIPVIANGDIDSPEKARFVLDYTSADAVMIGRAAMGRPWIFRDVDHYLRTGERLPGPTIDDIKSWLLGHLDDHYRFYGEYIGVRTARKHISWYLSAWPNAQDLIAQINQIETTSQQASAVRQWLDSAVQRSVDERQTKLAA
jgi:tRNA-dihydrouridine synthase B